MRAVVQRVKEASVTVAGDIKGKIDKGLLVFVGIGEGDTEEDVRYLVDKIVNLRIFEDDTHKMNLSALDLNREILAVSQFTLYGDCRKGRRPNFTGAAKPRYAEKMYDTFVKFLKNTGLKVEEGVFQAMMEVNLINDGPVTILLDSNKQF
ncbi:D-aminoacyl-tRNA deacylase [Halothermothrix orenii]|uniref:D-aminoacyl-tRNA deacylase n=1 Tax=Halothermothrix orenii (strain H 168 / OCM 544 / DSM 9562) TaxID=373903 RepID=DTD_HALOH|nr:D-aminoacyl-tRNA deacylase [Halothermothrix orenii]B8CXE9.1 RecName: Full=D-aminoacyl-tRNA deacylase; Short=DTD; AltName: Full=Gly-tRNA(Ala) deacylase [Halothermothrix orenii H 168]ACL69968.1 D-tyrosyl-tRNA(Tyr) deacylase [Halothermothrix orenii H 168]